MVGGHMGWIDLAQDKNKWPALVSALITARGISWLARVLTLKDSVPSIQFIYYGRAFSRVLYVSTKLHSVAFQKTLSSQSPGWNLKPQYFYHDKRPIVTEFVLNTLLSQMHIACFEVHYKKQTNLKTWSECFDFRWQTLMFIKKRK
jgi:hypothetical protein